MELVWVLIMKNKAINLLKHILIYFFLFLFGEVGLGSKSVSVTTDM